MTGPLGQLDFAEWLDGSDRAAAVLVPLVLEAVRPASVVDVGCGLGAWLAAFGEHGVEDLVGYDGPWVDRSRLVVPPGRFRTWDLREPLPVDRRFDLAVCLEVAHLLEEGHADHLVGSLAALSDVVLFSAGIPGQPGTQHLNLQWPRYWAERFAAHGLVASDPFRAAVWEHPDVKWWFAQNIVCFATEEALARSNVLHAGRPPGGGPLPLVHPSCLAEALEARPTPDRRRRRWRSAT